MAGDIKRQRKSWTLQGSHRDRSCCFFFCSKCIDRSKVSINILRANLAEEGDEDAQLDMAKRLLQESSSSSGEVSERTQNENSRLALYWLIKSSEQGNVAATQLLKECLDSGRGLTAQNILDVRTCVTTPKDEKLTFKAARLLYRKLSNGEEFITTAQLLARLKKQRKNMTFPDEEFCTAGKNSENALPATYEEAPNEDVVEDIQKNDEEKEENSDKVEPQKAEEFSPMGKKNTNLNETFIVPKDSHRRSFASQKQQRTPENNFKLQEQQSTISGKSENFEDLQFAMTQPGKKLTLQDLLNVAKDLNRGVQPRVSLDEKYKILSRHKWKMASIPNAFILQFFVLAVLGNMMLATDALAYLIFVGIFESCYNFLLWSRIHKNFEDWKLAFESVLKENSWTTETFQRRLTQHYLITHLTFTWLGSLILSFKICDQFVFLSLVVGTTSVISIQIGILQRLLPSLQQIFILVTSLFYYNPDTISNLFGGALSMSQVAMFLHQPISATAALGDHFLLSQVNGFTILIIAILITTLKLSLQRIFLETIPEIAQCIWLVKVAQLSMEQETSTVTLGVCTGMLLCGFMRLLCSKMKLWKIFIVVMLGIFAAAASAAIIEEGVSREQTIAAHNEEGKTFLEWEDYEVTCHRRAWIVQNTAATQIKCSSLYEDMTPALVKWKGRISTVKAAKIERSSWMDKTFGVADVVFDISVGIFPTQRDDGSRNWQFLSGSNDGESLAPSSVIVKTSELWDRKQKQALIDHILNLRTGDKIEFVGKLQGSTAGSLTPQIVDVQSLQCLSCATADYGVFVIKRGTVIDYLRVITKLEYSKWFLHFCKKYFL